VVPDAIAQKEGFFRNGDLFVMGWGFFSVYIGALHAADGGSQDRVAFSLLAFGFSVWLVMKRLGLTSRVWLP
jgi:hypothetical protein